MKKIIIVFAIACLTLSIAGCGVKKIGPNEPQIPPANYSGEIKG